MYIADTAANLMDSPGTPTFTFKCDSTPSHKTSCTVAAMG